MVRQAGSVNVILIFHGGGQWDPLFVFNVYSDMKGMLGMWWSFLRIRISGSREYTGFRERLGFIYIKISGFREYTGFRERLGFI